MSAPTPPRGPDAAGSGPSSNGAPAQRRATGMSAGTLVGICAALVVVMVVAVGGSFAGFAWGQVLGHATAGGRTPAQADPAPSQSPTPLGFRGDWPMGEDAPFQGPPELRAPMPRGWDIVPTQQAHTDEFRNSATGCVFLVNHGSQTAAAPGITDASGSGAVVGGYVGAMRKDSRFSSVTSTELAPMWVSVNGGSGRVQLFTERIAHVQVSSGHPWVTFLVTRVFAQPSSFVFASLDCPAAAGVGETSPAAQQSLGVLTLVGW